MKRLVPRSPIAIVILIGLSAPGFASAQSTDSTAEKQIRGVLESQQSGWNRGDIDAFMNGYARADSTTFVSEDKIVRGWQTVRDRYRKKYFDRSEMGSLTFSNLQIVPLSHDSALAIGTWKLKRKSDEPHGRFTLMFRLTNNGWRIVYDHTSAAPTPK